MKRRIKKDNDRRDLLNIPVPESEVVEVTESDTEKDADGKDDKTKDEGSKLEHHSRRDERSPDRRRTPPRRRPSPQRYRPYVALHCLSGTDFHLISPMFPNMYCDVRVQIRLTATVLLVSSSK